jgi:hypothetical protein
MCDELDEFMVGFSRVEVDPAGKYAFAVCQTIGVPMEQSSKHRKLGKRKILEMFHLLCGLHRCGFVHGDPRIPNFISTTNGLKFIDNDCVMIRFPNQVRRDWKIFLASIVGHLDKQFSSTDIDSHIELIFQSETHHEIFKKIINLIIGSSKFKSSINLDQYTAWIDSSSDSPINLCCDCVKVRNNVREDNSQDIKEVEAEMNSLNLNDQ